METFFNNLFSGLTLEIILVLGGAAALGYAKQKLPQFAPTLVYAFLGATCVAILIFTFTGRAVFSKAPAPLVTVENIEENTKLWAEHLGMTVGPATEPDSSFAHTFALQSDNSVTVFRSHVKPDYLQFKSIVTVAPEHEAAFYKMSPNQLTRIIEQLNLDIGRSLAGVAFGEIYAKNDQLHKTVVTGFLLERGIPIQDMNERVFGDAFDLITRGAGMTSAFVRLSVSPQVKNENIPVIATN
jgi:hypothetical protein